ncbi:hypothetical protein KC960_02050 [Candidatus Saccharibacteria bacterium]|nr:hypothetical protein [Candidatus Saccharibacteria bacterium]
MSAEIPLPPPVVETRQELLTPVSASGNSLPSSDEVSDEWWTQDPNSTDVSKVLPDASSIPDRWWEQSEGETTSPMQKAGSAILDLSQPDEAHAEDQKSEEVARNAERAKQAGEGWKLHLNFDYTNPQHVRKVQEVLDKLASDKAITTFKIGNGGGVESGAPGKEATVYIGSMSETQKIAEIIDKELSGVLLPATGDVLQDDLPFSGNVWGRFSVVGSQPKVDDFELEGFLQYGRDGVPSKRKYNPWNPAPKDYILADSIATLRKLYGEFFDNGQLAKLLERKRTYLGNQTREGIEDYIDEAIGLRNKELDRLLDPENMLPKIELVDEVVDNPENNSVQHRYTVVDRGGSVGGIWIDLPYDGSPAKVFDVNLQKNKGYGKAAYLGVLKRLPDGVVLTSGLSVSEDAIKIWRWLEQSGVATRPEGEIERTENGKYRRPGYVTRTSFQ